MKRMIFLLLVAAVFAVPSFAGFHFGVNAGYSYSSMAELNGYWKKLVDASTAQSATVTAAEWQKYGSGFFVNADLDLSLVSDFNFGARAGVQYIFPGKFTGLREIMPGTWIIVETTNDAYLIPLMLGFNANFKFGDAPFSLTASLYGGWGIAYDAENTKYNGSAPYTTLYTGGSPMADASAAFEISIMPGFTISINGGYRFVSIDTMKVAQKVSVNIPGYGTYTRETNDPLADPDGTKVAADFSGINLGLGANIRF